MKPSISVVAPTRGRLAQLDSMLSSLTVTADDRDRVEVVLRCDDDDEQTINYLRACHRSFIVGPSLNGYTSLAVFINEAARLSHADLVLVVNDDAKFETQGWDRKLVDAAASFPDGIFDFGVDTVMNNPNFVFPCTSRRVVDLIGVHDERVIYNDIWLRDVMSPFGRAVHVPEVRIQHEWAGMSDSQQRAMGVVQTPAYEENYARCVAEAQEKIRGALTHG